MKTATLLLCLALAGCAMAQPLRERSPSLAASPAAAAYDAAASAPAPATTARYAAPPFHAASPASGPGGPQKLAEITAPSGAPAGDSIYNILKAQAAPGGHGPQFTYLVAMVDKAGLAPTLADPGLKATLLAPTDAAVTAFAERAGKQPGDLLADKPEVLKAILLQHVIAQSVPLSSLQAGETLPTKGAAGVRVASTNPVRLAVAGGSAPGDDTTTAEKGVATFNGEGHVIAINRVLLPPMSAVENAQP